MAALRLQQRLRRQPDRPRGSRGTRAPGRRSGSQARASGFFKPVRRDRRLKTYGTRLERRTEGTARRHRVFGDTGEAIDEALHFPRARPGPGRRGDEGQHDVGLPAPGGRADAPGQSAPSLRRRDCCGWWPDRPGLMSVALNINIRDFATPWLEEKIASMSPARMAAVL